MFTSRIVVSILLTALCASGSARTALASRFQATTGPPETQSLPPGVPLERALGGGESHTYRLALAAGQFLRLEVEQRGVEVAVTLRDCDGRPVAASDLPHVGVEWVSLIAESDAELRLEIRAANSGAAAAQAGGYVVMLAELRAATESDRRRVAADQSLTAGERLRAQESAEARRSAAGKYEEALALYRALGDRRGETVALYSLGVTHALLGERRQALEYCQPALPLAQSLGERLLESHLLQTLGALCYALNQAPQAVDYFQQVLPLLRALGARQREPQAFFSLGIAHARMGDRLRTIEVWQQARSLWQTLGDRAGEARALAALGGNYEALGEKQKAVEFLEQALPLLRGVGDRETEANTLYQLGLAYDTLNERPKAVASFSQALALRKAIGHPQGPANLHRSLSGLYDGLGDLPQALAHGQQALALYEAAQDYRGTAAMLRNIGLVYDRLGEKQQAAAHFKRALPLFRLGADRQSLARLLANLGKVLSESGDHEQALNHLNEALPLLRQLQQQFFEVYALYWIAHAERGRGNLNAARTHTEAALEKIEGMRRDYYQTDLRAVGFTKARDFYELELDLLARLATTEPELIATALEVSEQARARTMLDLLAEARADPRAGLAPELQQREQANQTRLAALQSQLIQLRQQAQPDPARSVALQRELQQAEAERAQLENELRRRHPRYAEMLYPVPLRAEAIRQLLDDETALLEYALGQESSFLFVVTREGLSYRRLPPAAEINRLGQEVRRALEQPGRGEFANFTRAASRLYELLLAPVESELTGKSRLLIAPDGALYYLPFECLPAKIAGQGAADYLLKRWTISYVPSASVLASLRQNRRPAAPGKQFVAFADPVYSTGANGSDRNDGSDGVGKRSLFAEQERWDLVRLAESRREVTEIARLYRPGQTALYLGAEAREENIKGNPALATARRLHFATHGLISASHPQRSALALTLDDDPREDGLLQMWEIFNLKLQADLVTLSACQTGLGQELTGEGIVGLARAFMYAGAPSVVVSLWNVTDRSTAELMVKFHQHLDRTADKAEALRQAKLELLRNPRYASPYYWAPFVLIGEPK
jgi:CHAT domain-containing protein